MTTALSQESTEPRVSSDEALRVARLDAEKVYRDLSPYRVTVVLEADGWHVDDELKNPNVQGGGPHYLVDIASGAILKKRYTQ